MSFKHSCFISYSHNPGELNKRLIRDLHEALSNEINTLMRDKDVYIDWERLRGGDFYNEALAKALCHSVCMIMVYTPTYFDKNHTFCTREFKAMQEIERKRLEIAGRCGNHGLIIPIIFRGREYIPQFISNERHCYFFDNYYLSRGSENILATHRKFSKTIREIAEYIFERYNELSDVWDSSRECNDFRLPSEEDVSPLLVEFRAPFPGHREGKS
ncbi:toll/interleukin-1 receptor domain-containing protein [Candidatus Methanocrinis natronophilus]|uniref:Toll/interleukin-1 receptor domain-containing protein n=1 Tax=Candidatus Methanocrinis natronophilus TaxID=3033396 RepID=A0ABT5X6S5_9EURY|nr:toll/interleukin-1 receptor domain-containing protein [Candidatus Methanocrinis natronophilus]MDF0590403.1 toll/interleukin-1 receptor domain-containing protein [Candidatus Methanocrinis natronophilus]